MNIRPLLLGIVNITEDSFSDGGLYLAPAAALEQARALISAGADIIDLGAAASNPSAKPVPSTLEIERLAPLVDGLQSEGVSISIDSFLLQTQCWALGKGVVFLNDIRGFGEPSIYSRLAESDARLIVMHALRGDGPARVEDETPPDLFENILAFFRMRVGALIQAGIACDRLILDPGMGLFLGRNRAASFEVLRRISELRAAFGLPVLVSVSRKSFLRPLGRKPHQAGAATLAAELFAAAQGADYIRTHDPGALRDALNVMQALEGGGTSNHSEIPHEFSAIMTAVQKKEGQSA